MRKLGILCTLGLLIFFNANAQFNKDSALKYVSQGRKDISSGIRNEVKTFYQAYPFKYAWLKEKRGLQQLEGLLEKSKDLGLREGDYPIDLIRSLLDSSLILQSEEDSLFAEVTITAGAVHFFRDVAYGNSPPILGYNGLGSIPDCLNIPDILTNALSENDLSEILQQLEPASAGYNSLKNQLILFNERIQNSSFLEIHVRSAKVSRTNPQLLIRLYDLGITENPDSIGSDEELVEKIKTAQRLFNLPDDGQLRPAILTAMNVPLAVRIEELKSALNTVRWLRCADQSSPAILINIPSANLLVYASDRVIIQSKVIVGKNSTRTPTLASRITDVILYPFWMVPKKIATRELLPMIKRNPGYLEDNNLQVLGPNGRVISPDTIHWQQLSAGNFPYQLRQSTGCDNSLGIVKFNFYSPFGVYLHDTPEKNLFKANKRYFSHGCIRVEKAIDLAHFILKEKSADMDKIIERGCLPDQAPVFIPITEKIPIFVLYNTAWFDSLGNLQFNGDIYQKLQDGRKKTKQ